MLRLVNYGKHFVEWKELRDQFMAAEPFQHVEIEELVRPDRLQDLASAFPDENWENWQMYPSEHVPNSKVCESTTVLPDVIREFILELNSGPFITLLEKVTGIEGLLPDPHLKGGGMHLSLAGGALTPHTDYYVKDKDPRYRRLNLILYLNDNWQPQHQGCFELWDTQCTNVVKEVPPIKGKALLFRTDSNSVHGFSKPVRGPGRKSIALFYYTARDNLKEFGGTTATYWRPGILEATGPGDWLRLLGQGLMWTFSRWFGYLSWQCQRAATRLSEKSRLRRHDELPADANEGNHEAPAAQDPPIKGD
ncbi:MAG: 2OG-Fe(II) oxygenase [Halioglobus sp.]|nr:2OG-Fe(II) oxygenase [Halioglobus sp.]